MENKCLQEFINQSQDKCAYVTTFCNNQSSIPFINVYYCFANDNIFMLIIFAVTFFILLKPFFLILMFNLLQRTAENYLSPSVASIAKHYKLSQTFAGITLIAFANGAPDVITAIIASGEDSSGIFISIGSIFGSGILMTTFVFGSVLYFSKNLIVNKISFLRDTIFNSIAIFTLIVFGYFGKITILFSIFFVFLYFIYIIIVLINEKQEQKSYEQNQNIMQFKTKNNEEFEPLLNENENILVKLQTKQQYNIDFENQIKEQEFLEENENLNLTLEIQDNSQEIDDIDLKSQSFIQKLMILLTIGIPLVIKYTIPVSTKLKVELIIQLLFCPLTIILMLDLIDVKIFNISIFFIFYFFDLLVIIWYLLYGIPKIFITILTTICSIIWCKFLVEILIDFIILIQIITGINPSYLGMTILAFGNSICDLLVNTKLAKMGLGIMAITGCFSGAFFNLSVGFGMALIKSTWNGQIIQFDIFTEKHTLQRQTRIISEFLLIFAFFNMILTLLITLILRFQLKQKLSYYYFAYYSLFLCCLSCLCVYVK